MDPGTIVIKALEDWITFSEAADILGFASHQGVHYLVWTAQAFDFDTEVRSIGGAAARRGRMIYLLRLDAVQRVKAERERTGARAGRVDGLNRPSHVRDGRRRDVPI